MNDQPTKSSKKPNSVTRRYADRKAAFVVAAIPHINSKGVSGMTLADVAADLGLAPKAVAYYFPKKEDLAVACFLRGISHISACVLDAGHGQDKNERIKLFLRAYFDFRRRGALGEIEELTSPNDIRAMNEPTTSHAYAEMFRAIRSLISDPSEKGQPREIANARTHLLVSHCNWANYWLPTILPERIPHACEHLIDIVLNGLATAQTSWVPKEIASVLPMPDIMGETTDEMFLRAATELINEEGYHGASVERISARIDLSKGAFYHHIKSKDDLVLACFDRTIEVLRSAMLAAEAVSSNGLQTLATFSVALAKIQISGVGLLLKMSAFTTLPVSFRGQVLVKYTRIVNMLASVVSDGIADGSVRAVDANLAAEAIIGMINSADELRFFARGIFTDHPLDHYVKPCFVGLFNNFDAH